MLTASFLPAPLLGTASPAPPSRGPTAAGMPASAPVLSCSLLRVPQTSGPTLLSHSRFLRAEASSPTSKPLHGTLTSCLCPAPLNLHSPCLLLQREHPFGSLAQLPGLAGHLPQGLLLLLSGFGFASRTCSCISYLPPHCPPRLGSSLNPLRAQTERRVATGGRAVAAAPRACFLS